MRFKDDGGSASEIELASQSSTDYNLQFKLLVDPPAGTWDDYLDSNDLFNGTGGTASDKKLEIGLRTPAANDVNIRATALGVEICALGDDPPLVVTPVIILQAVNRASVI